jgi:ribosome biogenesis GTPase
METGRIVASFGRTVEVEDERGERIDCAILGRRLAIVCADQVRFARESPVRGIVHELLPRRSLVTRCNSRGEPEPVAANATQLVVVLAHPPLPDFFLVDRYLAAAPRREAMSAGWSLGSGRNSATGRWQPPPNHARALTSSRRCCANTRP